MLPGARASGRENWEGDIQITKLTFHPKLPGADRETEAQQARLAQGHTMSATEPRETEIP